MKTDSRFTTFITALTILFTAFTTLAAGTPAISDVAGQWQGKSRFTGISYAEYTQKKVAHQDIDIVLQISPDGKVTGRVGGAELSDCVVELNRGWLGRLLHIETDYIIRGQITGAVATGSESGTHAINAPFDLVENRIHGTLFVVHPFVYPYPISSLRLNREGPK